MANSFDELVKRTTTKSTRSKAARRGRELVAERLLSEARKLAGKSQREVARALGIKQPSLFRLKHQDDMQISTLKRIVEGLGGEVHVLARFPQGMMRFEQFDGPSPRKSSGKYRELVIV